MAGFLVYRPVTDDRNTIEFDIGGFLVNGADATAAKAAALAVATRFCGPNNANLVNAWTATEISSSDFGVAIANTVLQGPVVLVGQHLRGGGMIV